MRVAMLAASLSVLVAGTAFGQAKWDMPTPYAASSYHTENIQQFVADFEKASGGKVKITVHSNGSLFKGDQIKRAVQSGQAPIGEVLISSIANEDAVYAIDSIPFVATSYADAAKLWRVSRKVTEERLAKQGMRLLYAVPWPPQALFSIKPVTSGAELKGMKFRAYNPATSRLAELAGMTPVTVQLAELAQALVTGAIQAHITSSAGGYDTKAWEVTKYFYDTQAWIPKNMIFVNQRAFAGLDKATQDALVRAAADAETRGWKISEDRNKGYIDQLREKGMTVSAPSPQLMADLKKIGDTMAADWVKTAGPDGQAILDAYRK